MPTHGGRGNRARFATTRWSLVLSLGNRTNKRAEAALATLCELYWFPVYAYIRRLGTNPDAAADLTQGFFTKVVEKGYFEQARQQRGRFRSFLLASVKHFLASEYRSATSQKRGGDRPALPLEFDEGARRYANEPVDTRTPEDEFDARWASHVFAAARARLEDKHRAGWMRGSRFFEPLLQCALDERHESYEEMAGRLQTSEGSLRVLAHRVRQQFAVCLREVIGDTVENSEAVDDELRYLQAVLERTRHSGPV